MNQFWNLVFSGLVTGAIYSIMASGIVLTYQTSGIFNFAYGSLANDTALEVDGMNVMSLLNNGSIAGAYHNQGAYQERTSR